MTTPEDRKRKIEYLLLEDKDLDKAITRNTNRKGEVKREIDKLKYQSDEGVLLKKAKKVLEYLSSLPDPVDSDNDEDDDSGTVKVDLNQVARENITVIIAHLQSKMNNE